MAFDISLDESPQKGASPDLAFDEFYAQNVALIGTALALACDDDHTADKALAAALVRTSQRWKHLAGHDNAVGWALNAGLQDADKSLRDRSPAAVNRATGGYVRGLDLVEALAELPLNQRAALVLAYFLGWIDDFIAAGFETSTETITTRRTRALTFLAHHLMIDVGEVPAILAEHFAGVGAEQHMSAPGVPDVRRRGRRLTARNRIAAGLLVIAVIAAGGALFRVSTASEPAATGPKPVAPPTNSSDWIDPIGDGRGGFIALNTSGASRFVRSSDGITWFDAAIWNSRAVDLRTEVSGLERTGGRYVATIEAAPAISGFVTPHIATSTDLRSWAVRSLDVELPERVAGLRTDYEVLSVAAAGPHVVATIGVSESLDYRFYGLRPVDVCAESTSATQLVFYLCDGSTFSVDRPESTAVRQARLFAATEGADFDEVQLPADIEPRSITGFGDGFAAVNAITGELWSSIDGRSWTTEIDDQEPNRFVLVEGHRRGVTVVIRPGASGWPVQTLSHEGAESTGSVPIVLDPAAVWTQPELASGPAGWALFVTTSRPWERSDITPGWAVDTGSWIVSRQPDSVIITAQSADGAASYRFLESAEWVRIGTDGNVTLRVPDSGEDLVTVTQDQIDRSRQAGPAGDDIKAQVFFSSDGQSWRSIWESDKDAWFGTLAVGDDEVLLSGTRLPGRPISIPILDE